jgi:xanthine dehydrogenase accessory factor
VRDLVSRLPALLAAGQALAVATVVSVRGSAPRPVGTSMAVTSTGEVLGSLSGGCVEGAVYEAAQQVLAEGLPCLNTYGISDEHALEAGLTCGGVIDVFIAEPELAALTAVSDALARDEPIALATVFSASAAGGRQLAVTAEGVHGSLSAEGLQATVVETARAMLAAGQSGLTHYGAQGQRETDGLVVFVQSFAPPPRLVVFGATDFAGSLSRIGGFLGFHVTLCDARAVFATPDRFPDAHEVVCQWPDRYLTAEVAAGRVDARTALCVMTHDLKFDVPLLRVALSSPAGYVGAMGSRRAHDDRLRRLAEAGVPGEQLQRLRSPIGLDLGARTTEETAVSIAAELVQTRWKGTGKPLSQVKHPIHGNPVSGPLVS